MFQLCAQANLKTKQEEQRRLSLKLQKHRERSNSFNEEEDKERRRRLNDHGILRFPDKRLSQVHDQLLDIFEKLKVSVPFEKHWRQETFADVLDVVWVTQSQAPIRSAY